MGVSPISFRNSSASVLDLQPTDLAMRRIGSPACRGSSNRRHAAATRSLRTTAMYVVPAFCMALWTFRCEKPSAAATAAWLSPGSARWARTYLHTLSTIAAAVSAVKVSSSAAVASFSIRRSHAVSNAGALRRFRRFKIAPMSSSTRSPSPRRRSRRTSSGFSIFIRPSRIHVGIRRKNPHECRVQNSSGFVVVTRPAIPGRSSLCRPHCPSWVGSGDGHHQQVLVLGVAPHVDGPAPGVVCAAVSVQEGVQAEELGLLAHHPGRTAGVARRQVVVGHESCSSA